MITKISQLKNFGIFQDFSWEENVNEFKRFNLIYGWNRSGKTTLSRVFASCEKKSIYDADKYRQYPENGEFEINSIKYGAVKHLDVTNNTLQIKVFNQDFIDENISFDSSDYCNPIVYVSEEDIESKKQLDKLKGEKIGLQKSYDIAKIDRGSKESVKNNFLTGLGREIANLLFDKTYNKTKVENRINNIGVDNFINKILSDEDNKKYEEISKSSPENEQPILKEISSENWEFLYQQIKILLDKKIVTELLERLKDPDDSDGGLDEELNSWVKHGFDLHKTKNQFKKCLFCENELNSNFFDSLAKHFSNDYQQLQDSITFLINDIKSKKISFITEENYKLYRDLRKDYESASKKLNVLIKKHNDWLWDSEIWLGKKYINPFDPDIPEMVKPPENFSELINNQISGINEIILKHNHRVKEHDKEVKAAREKLELHSIAFALAEQNYRKIESDLQDALLKEKQSLDAVNKNESEISELEKKSSNIGIAIKEINKHLKSFFGQEEIVLELDTDKKGYIIMREGKPAVNLSEGEKTAIAFSYFIVKVGEKGSALKNSIVFIDDPISSFDSNFIYHSFGLVKTQFKDPGQLFISTHNFQFFNLVKDWFIRKNRNIEEDNKERKLKGKNEKPLACEFYMIKNELNLNRRTAKINLLDDTLRRNKSEYTFLFRLLNDFSKKTEEPTFEEIYNIGNIGRRFFDIYADFKIPTNSKEQKEKLDIIVREINKNKPEGEKITDTECEKILWLINSFSHNSDPTSTIQHQDKSESIEVIKRLLKIVKESDNKHYEVLEQF